MRLRRRLAVDLPAGELVEAFRFFRPALRGQRRRAGAAVALALGATALELAKPWPITWVLDHVITSTEVPSLGPVLIFAAVAALVPTLLGLTNERLQLVVAQVSRKATVRIRSDVFEHLQRIGVEIHQDHRRGDLLVRLMGDVNMIRDLLFPSWLNLLGRGSILLGATVVFAVVDWRLFLVALIPIPLLWLTVERGSSAVRLAAGKQRRKEGAIAATASESLEQVGIIKAFSAEERVSHRFRSTARSAERATMAAARETARMARLTEVLTGLGVALVLIVGAQRVRASLLTPGQLVLAVSYTRLMYKPIRKLTGEGARLAKATACAGRVIELLSVPVEAGDGEQIDGLDGPLQLSGVGYRYPDDRVALAGLDLRIEPGQLVVVNGDNGAGKSTLLALLLRLRKPTEGTISIGGRDITELELSSYRDHVAYVPQDLALFGGTIRENLALARPLATDREMLEACAVARFDDVLDELPAGLDTELDESGASLSGGQARRLMLARAVLRDASLLLFDEPLTGLDPEVRPIVIESMLAAAASRTTIVVHHGDPDELRPDRIVRLTTPVDDSRETVVLR